jgi:hypothetical protein
MLYYPHGQKTNERRGGNRGGVTCADMYLYPLQAPVAATGSGTEAVSVLSLEVLGKGTRLQHYFRFAGDGSGR